MKWRSKRDNGIKAADVGIHGIQALNPSFGLTCWLFVGKEENQKNMKTTTISGVI